MANKNSKTGKDQLGRFTKGNDYGRKGAAVTNTKYAAKKREWGRKGYETTVSRHFGGDEQAANEWLFRKGQAAQDELYGYSDFYFVAEDPGPHPAHLR